MDRDTAEKIAEDAVKPWLERSGNLIMILHQVQNRCSYVPREVAFEIGRRLDIPLAQIYEVITFYHYFRTEAPGDHVVSVCMGTACYLKGAPKLLGQLEHSLGIQTGHSTEDRSFHLQAVRCLGCCGLAPVITVDDKVHARVKPEQVMPILAECSTGLKTN